MGSLVAGTLTQNATTAVFGIAPTDWAIWNGSWQKTATKSAGGATISNPVVVGGGLSDSFSASGVVTVWTNGSISAAGSVSNGIYVDGTAAGSFSAGVGYSLTFPADTTTRNAIIYLGAYSNQFWVTATLSDGAAPPLTLTSTAIASGFDFQFVCDFTYAANSPGQTLQIKVTMQIDSGDGFGNVQLQAAAYSTGAAGSVQSPMTFLLMGVGSG